MSGTDYDVYADLHVTHVEIGYLLAIGVALLVLDVAGAVALACWPPEDVYLVASIADCRTIPVHWGAPMPRVQPASTPPLAPIALPSAAALTATLSAVASATSATAATIADAVSASQATTP